MTRNIVPLLCLLSFAACGEVVTETSAELDAGLPDPAVATCMSAVAQQTGNGIVAPTKITTGFEGTTVSLGVGDERAPWECRVDRSGAVVALAPAAGGAT